MTTISVLKNKMCYFFNSRYKVLRQLFQYLSSTFQFLTALTNIGRLLAGVADKERRNGRLRAELASLDLNLPARVWLPLHHRPHYVLRIPPHAAAVLNSKDKVWYTLVYLLLKFYTKLNLEI